MRLVGKLKCKKDRNDNDRVRLAPPQVVHDVYHVWVRIERMLPKQHSDFVERSIQLKYIFKKQIPKTDKDRYYGMEDEFQ